MIIYNSISIDIMIIFQGAFQVPEQYHPYCLRKAGVAHRQWRARLVRHFMRDLETGEILTASPATYPNISQKEWDEFLEYHLGDEFKVIDIMFCFYIDIYIN